MTATAHRLLVLDDQPEAAAVRAFVASGAWQDAAAFRRIPTRNPRYEVYAFDLSGAGTPCILKIAQAAPAAHRGARRLEALVSHLAHDPARRALRGARLLAQNGLPTFRPLACWTARRGGISATAFSSTPKSPPAIRSRTTSSARRAWNPPKTPAPSTRSSRRWPISSPRCTAAVCATMISPAAISSWTTTAGCI